MQQRMLIVGAGQSGLQLGIGLLQHGYDVTIMADKTPDEIINSPPTSSQGMFNTALSYEKELGLNYWDDVSPENTSVTFSLANDTFSDRALYWQGSVNNTYRSIDQRVKFPRWMNTFTTLGGELLFEKITSKQLEKLCSSHDLVILATGKGELSKNFKQDITKTTFSQPQRTLSLTYVKNIRPVDSLGVRFNIVPGVGEYFIMPGLTTNGYCEMMLFEGIPNGAFDCWNDIVSDEQQLEQSIALLKKYVPWEAERCKYAELATEKAT